MKGLNSYNSAPFPDLIKSVSFHLKIQAEFELELFRINIDLYLTYANMIVEKRELERQEDSSSLFKISFCFSCSSFFVRTD